MKYNPLATARDGWGGGGGSNNGKKDLTRLSTCTINLEGKGQKGNMPLCQKGEDLI